ncbi:TonB-dependent receptor [uncultured Erythrobacter sp.]|uniref:TonB-dependent receptor plug domain-containing protein n=1 Tax=uncultured Erythrobacter sp. TaxID=263913 RepID=UPI002611B8FE|nr:TonB-dependent receptor [uncultured Erythrobacter sp.]
MKFQSLFAGASICALALSASALAQDEAVSDAGDAPQTEDGEVEYIAIPDARRIDSNTILVRADRTDSGLSLSDYTGSATIVSAEEMEQRQVRDVADVLRDVPGVAVSSVAGQTQLRLRGSEANHVLVLVDGIEVSDPFSGEFDIGTLQAEIGSRVEVLRGPQSALYGSDAIGGVVAYDSRSFSGFGARIEGGTNNTINGAARWGYNLNGFDVSLSATVVSTDGEPNARPINGGGTRDIGRDSYTVSGKIAVPVTDNFALRAAARYIRTEGQFNDQNFFLTGPTFGFVVDSPETRFENEAIYALVGAKLELADNRWSHDLSAQLADITRDTFGAFGPSNASEGDRLKASYVTSYRPTGGHSITFAADWEREQFRNATPGGFAFNGQREIENVGLVGEYRYAGERFDFSAAIRHDINDRFADETTFQVGAGFNLTESTRLRASAGSGIKNPGFFELFGFVDGRFIGNADLTPEKSTSWEVGIEQSLLGGDATLSATYFDATLEDEIFTTFPAPTFVATPANRTTDSNQRGVELALSAQIAEQWSLNAAYAYLDAEENGVTEVRRPESIASAALTWTAPQEAASATLVIRHNGSTEDLAFLDPSFVPTRVTLDDYTLVNLNARVRLAAGLYLFARAENLLDENYEQVFSFVSPGRSVIAGFEATF